MSWREKAWALKREIYALVLACRDPRVPWYAKALAAGVVAYAVSPIDLIPDFIPVLGLMDDLVLVPLAILAVRAMVPPEVLQECRVRAAGMEEKRSSRTAAAVIVPIWIAAAAALAIWLLS